MQTPTWPSLNSQTRRKFDLAVMAKCNLAAQVYGETALAFNASGLSTTLLDVATNCDRKHLEYYKSSTDSI